MCEKYDLESDEDLNPIQYAVFITLLFVFHLFWGE